MLLNGILLCGNMFLATILDTFACGINFLLNNKMKVDKENPPPPPKKNLNGGRSEVWHTFPGRFVRWCPGNLRTCPAGAMEPSLSHT